MAETYPSTLPKTIKALIYKGPGEPLNVETVPMPTVIPGSVLIKVECINIDPAMGHLLSGKVPGLHTPTPCVPGTRALGRVAATSVDTTLLKPGQLVVAEPFIRGRDNDLVQFLWGAGVFGGDPAAIKLCEDVWRNGAMAEYALLPLENVHPLNEEVLLEKGFGYSIADLSALLRQVVAYGGFRGIDLKAGETVIVAPATGAYSSAAVEVASAMGARVIAASRNLEQLKKVQAANERVEIVQLKGDVQEDLANLSKFGTVDAFLDISPAAANDSTHVRSCIMAVKQYGRISLMGIINKDIAVPYVLAVLKNLTIRGQYMYEREDVQGLIKLVESGVLKLGKKLGHKVAHSFKLEEWEEAFRVASETKDPANLVIFNL